MSSSIDNSTNSEGYNAKLYIHKLSGGAIHFDDTWLGERVLALQPTITTLQVPRRPNITTRLLTSGEVTIELPKTTFEGTVHFGDQQIPVEGQVGCDLRKVELKNKQNMYAFSSRDSWFQSLKKRDVVSGFKSIGIESKCANKMWMKNLYIPEAGSGFKNTYDSSQTERRSRKYMNIKWDEKTQSLHRIWTDYKDLIIDLSVDRGTTVQRKLTMIDQGVLWMYKEGVDGRLQSVNEDNGNEEEARLISDLNMELINGISERRANTQPTVSITGRSVQGDSNSVEKNGLSTLDKILSHFWTPTSTSD
ncbi:hypothetical protein V865_004145 [Kwoniella europaea PYCC6329]|uniref:Uncharacterized protein n=1 Tax=Kwoniella europaea PYCC6329 TaxID=1423913 RepID=A0AAX4KKJ2_9TREE